jgi:hypothetical protein
VQHNDDGQKCDINAIIQKMKERKLKKIEDEIWVEIPYTDNRYEISNYGRLKSYCYDQIKGRLIKPGKIRGFNTATLKINGKLTQVFLHKLVAEFFAYREKDEQTVVIHNDWNKQNNYFMNLKWVTRAESYARMHERLKERRKKLGKQVTSSKLKTEDVALLKSMLDRGIKQKVIAKLFCISEMQVTRIKRNENWAEVLPQEVEV